MKHLHVHVCVGDFDESIRFYSTLFASPPSVRKDDYAKWMLDDPFVNFAISKRDKTTGIRHLGIQVESREELAEMFERIEHTQRPVLDEGATTCCYARSEKNWVEDPQGVQWETFLTTGESTVYGMTPSKEPVPGPAVRRRGPHELSARPRRVLFLCTGNSARSIMAEGLLNLRGRGRFVAYSAGSHPKGEVHPLALELLAERGLPAAGLRSKGWDEFAGEGAPELDIVITVCDAAAGEVCPVWPGQPATAHWSIADPAAVQGEEQRAAFRAAFDELDRRIRMLVDEPMRKP